MKISFLKKTSILLLIAAFALINVSPLYTDPSHVEADVLEERITKLKDADDENMFLDSVVKLASILSVFALIGLSIYGGFVMLTSQGDPEKLGEAREIITNAVLGFALIALSVAVLLIIQSLLNLDMTS